MPSHNDDHKQKTTVSDELFFDQLKDQFAFFYALTVAAMEAYKKARARHRDSEEASKDR